MWKNPNGILALGVLVGALLASGVSAQDLTSRLDGTVKDRSGGIIPGASVVLTNVETNAAREVLTNDSGNFIFARVPQGRYSLSAQMPGFSTSVIKDVVVETGIPTTVEITLEVGDVVTEVIVTAADSQRLLNTVSAEINTLVNQAQIEELPLNGRDPTQFALLQAGVTGGGSIAREASVNGMRGTFNNMTLDGINNQDNFIRTDAFFGVIPLRESFVEEFALTTSNSDSASGLGGSQAQFITRSGTNEYHGQVYYYHQNDALNANEFFNNAAGLDKPRLLNHQYGFSVGGPVKKDKLFFFFNYEKEKSPQTASITRTVLTQAAREGDFTYLDPSGTSQTVNLFDLTGVSPDSTMSSLIGRTPLPNDPGSTLGDGFNTQGFRFNSDASTDQDWVVARVDYEVASGHTLAGKFHQFRFDAPNDTGNDLGEVFPGLPGAGQSSTRRLGSFSWQAAWSPALQNEARFGFQYAPVDFVNNETYDSGYRLHWTSDLATDPIVDNPVRDFLPQGRTSPVIEVADNANWIFGNHTFSFGGDFRWMQVDSYNDAGIIPVYSLGFNTSNLNPLTSDLFPGGISTNDLNQASELLAILGGFLNDGEQSFNVSSRSSGFVDGATQARVLKQNFFSLHGGDTWRLSPDLNLSVGLRWEYHTVPYERDGLGLLPVGGIEAVLDPNAVIDFAGPGGARPFFNNDYNNFAPNLGLAWRLGDRTVARAGYTVNFVIDNNMTVVQNALVGNDGLNQTVNIAGLAGTVSSGVPAIPIPEFQVPRTARDQILADSAAAIYTIDPDLRVPYVQQWNIGIQHEFLTDMAVEVRYVGNHGVKLGRAVDLNQVIFPAEFVADFQRAQRNLAANGSPSVGEPLTYIPQLGLGGFLQSSAVRTYIRNGEIGQYVGGFLAPNRVFFFAGEGGEDFGATVPISDFLRNPNAFVSDYVGNIAWSKYNALQVEFRRRFRDGLAAQVNYTFGKVLTNFSGTQTGFRGLFDNAQPNLEIMRPEYDITHTINGNYVWQLPFGKGRRFLSEAGPVDWFLGGWNTSGIIRLRSGETVNIVSARGTINRGGARAQSNSAILTGLSIPELQERTGAFRDSEGRVVLFDPTLIGADGRASTTYFTNPGLLEAGTLGLAPVSGPWYATFDFGLRKSFALPLTEESRAELRVDFFNLFNRANFNIFTPLGSTPSLDSLGIQNRHNINAADFGVIDDTFSAREMQVGLKITF